MPSDAWDLLTFNSSVAVDGPPPKFTDARSLFDFQSFIDEPRKSRITPWNELQGPPAPLSGGEVLPDRARLSVAPERWSEPDILAPQKQPGTFQPPTAQEEARAILGEPTFIDSAMETIARTGVAAGKGLADIPKAVAIAAKAIESRFGKDRDLKNYATWQMGDALSSYLDTASDPRIDRTFLNSTLPQAFGSSAAFFAGGLAAKGLGASSAAATAATALQGAASGAASGYEEAKRFGANDKAAEQAAGWNALVGLSEAAPIGRVFDRFNKATGGTFKQRIVAAFKAAGTGTVEEMSQEVFDQASGNLIAQQIYDKERSLVDGVLESGGAGGVVGFVSNMIASLAGGRKRGGVSRETDVPPTPTPAEAMRASLQQADVEFFEAKSKLIADHEQRAAAGQKDPTPSKAAFVEAGAPDEVAEGTRKVRAAWIERSKQEIADVAQVGRKDVLYGSEKTTGSDENVALGSPEGQVATAPEAAPPAQGTPGGTGVLGEPEFDRRVPIGEATPVEDSGPSTRPKFGEAAGVVKFDAITSLIHRGFTALRALVKANFLPEGDLPRAVFNLEQVRQRNINAVLSEATFAARDFESAMKEGYGNLAKDARTRAKVGTALNGGDLSTLPATVQSAARKMREHVDILSQRLIDEGVVDGDLAATVAENEGVYLHRSYRVFDDPNWADEVDPLVRNRFKSWLRAEYADKSDAQLEQLINNLLYEGKAAQGPIAFLKRSKLGNKDLSILKKRTLDDFPELRALYGEYSDPIVNYAKSVVRMANLIESHHFLEAVRADGLGKYLFDSADPNIDPQAKVRIAAEADSPMHPLNGLMTYPEIEKAFREAVAPREKGPNWLRWYIKANIATKLAKTAFSHATQARNWLGNINLMVANGYWRAGKAYDAVRAALEDLGLTKNERWREAVLAGTKHGVLRQSVQAGDVREMLSDLKKSGQDFDEVMGGWPIRATKKVGKVALELYGLGDDGPRFYGWLNEIADLQRAFPNITIEEARGRAAEIVNRVMPTYDALPPIIRKLRYFPGGSTFVSFPASMVKATYNILKQSFVELSNPQTRGIGAKRLTGFMVAKAGPASLALASMALGGIDDKEDEAIRKTLPPWDENGQLFYLQKPGPENNWTAVYLNLSSLDPFGLFDRAINAGLRGQNIADGFAQSVAEFLGNFIGEQIVFSKIADVLRNKRGDNGLSVYNAEDDGEQIFEAIAKHLTESLVPGTVTSLVRLKKAYAGEETETGKVFDPTTETIAQFGMRASKINLRTSLLYDVQEYDRRKSGTERIVSSKTLSAGPVSDADMADATQRSETNRKRLFDEMHEELLGLRKLGMPKNEIRKVLKAAGVGEEHRQDLIDGSYEPYKPSKSGVKARVRKLEIIRPESSIRVRERTG